MRKFIFQGKTPTTELKEGKKLPRYLLSKEPYSKEDKYNRNQDWKIRILGRIILPSKRPFYMENMVNVALKRGGIILARTFHIQNSTKIFGFSSRFKDHCLIQIIIMMVKLILFLIASHPYSDSIETNLLEYSAQKAQSEIFAFHYLYIQCFQGLWC